jgi:monoamine oxidase
MTQTTDVAIVGAGASGLRMANLLDQAGISIVVLEARDRVGGRLLTAQPGVDLGATWFWQNEHEVLEVISEFGLISFPQHTAGDMMYQVPGSIQKLDGNPLDQQAWRISGGMQSLTTSLANSLPIDSLKLSTKVTELRFENGVTIITDSGDFTARHVVVALPPATAIANITFHPDLPQELKSIAARTPVWMGAITKVVAIYDSPFWRSRGLAGSAMSHVGPLREIHDVSNEAATFGALFGFSRESVTREVIREQLVAIFGAEAANPSSLIIKDWSKSELTSPPNVSELNDYQLFGAKVLRDSHFDGRLYFSSTETSTNSPGHIQGAFSAARRTANQIINLAN